MERVLCVMTNVLRICRHQHITPGRQAACSCWNHHNKCWHQLLWSMLLWVAWFVFSAAQSHRWFGFFCMSLFTCPQKYKSSLTYCSYALQWLHDRASGRLEL